MYQTYWPGYLHDSDLGTFDLVSAARGTVGDPTHRFTTHAWLSQRNLIIDITSDQFTENEESVMVLATSSWHDTFHVSGIRTAGLEAIDGPVRPRLDKFYRLLMNLL